MSRQGVLPAICSARRSIVGDGLCSHRSRMLRASPYRTPVPMKAILLCIRPCLLLLLLWWEDCRRWRSQSAAICRSRCRRRRCRHGGGRGREGRHRTGTDWIRRHCHHQALIFALCSEGRLRAHDVRKLQTGWAGRFFLVWDRLKQWKVGRSPSQPSDRKWLAANH